MLKLSRSLKETETLASAALRGLLEKVPALRIEGIEADTMAANAGPGPDFIARLFFDGRKHLLICDYKSNGQPRYARSAMLELRNYLAHRASDATPVFMAPYISPAVRQMCEQNGIGYLDLEGNARIAFNGVFIERIVTDKPVVEQRELKSLFRPKSAQVLRAMLRQPSRAWRVTELSEISGVSLGHVSNVRTGLIDREWARASDDGVILSEPDALLDAWRDSYTAPLGEKLRFYTPLHGRALEDAARTVLSAEETRGRAVFASFSAANWMAPYGRTGTHYFFADTEGVGKLQAALKLEPTLKGENVAVTVPNDLELLADTVVPAPGAVCTSLIQTYLDLSIAGERGAEAAEHLRRGKLAWPS